MLKRGELTDRIIARLSYFSAALKEKAKLNLTDDNIYAEGFIRELLNIVYDYNLQDLNVSNSSFPGVDLGDKQKRIAYQITTTNTTEKIEAMLNRCLKYELYNDYDQFYLFILTSKKEYYSIKTITKPYFSFDYKIHVCDFSDLYRSIIQLGVKKLEEISKLVHADLPYAGYENNPESNEEMDIVPVLSFTFDSSFQSVMTVEEIELLLKEVQFRIKKNLQPYLEVRIVEEDQLDKVLLELKNEDRTFDVRNKIVDFNNIKEAFRQLKEESVECILLLLHANVYPVYDDTASLAKSALKVIELMASPDKILDETPFLDYFKGKYRGFRSRRSLNETKIDIYSKTNEGKNISFSIFLSEEEYAEFIKVDANTFSYLGRQDYIYFMMGTDFSSSYFAYQTLVEKIIPAFVDKIYDLKTASYACIAKDDYKSWNNLSDYKMGIG